MFDFLREFIIKYKKVLLIVVIFITSITAAVITSVNVRGNNEYEIDYSDKRFFNYVVEEGDSLWSVAESNMDYDYYNNVYEYMAELKRMNHLNSDKIYVGQKLIITYYVNHNIED